MHQRATSPLPVWQLIAWNATVFSPRCFLCRIAMNQSGAETRLLAAALACRNACHRPDQRTTRFRRVANSRFGKPFGTGTLRRPPVSRSTADEASIAKSLAASGRSAACTGSSRWNRAGCCSQAHGPSENCSSLCETAPNGLKSRRAFSDLPVPVLYASFREEWVLCAPRPVFILNSVALRGATWRDRQTVGPVCRLGQASAVGVLPLGINRA